MAIGGFIAFSSQQEGSAHEDHSIDKNYRFSKGSGMLIGGLPPDIYAIHGYGKTVYMKGVEFLQKQYPVRANSLI